MPSPLAVAYAARRRMKDGKSTPSISRRAVTETVSETSPKETFGLKLKDPHAIMDAVRKRMLSRHDHGESGKEGFGVAKDESVAMTADILDDWEESDGHPDLLLEDETPEEPATEDPKAKMKSRIASLLMSSQSDD